MQWDTHMISGALLGYYVTNHVSGAIVGGIGGIISDFDEPKSKFGKLVPFISAPLKKAVGHRTLTHSLPFAIVCGVLVSLFSLNIMFGIAFAVGIIAHAFGDMLTGKVKFLYPFKQTKYGVKTKFRYFYLIDRLAMCVLLLIAFLEVLDYFNITL